MSRSLSHTMEVEIAGATVSVDFEFYFTPGAPPEGPSYASGGEPGYGPEVEITKATLTIERNGKTELVESGRWLLGIFQDDEDLIGELIESVDDGPDPDEAYDRARDDRE